MSSPFPRVLAPMRASAAGPSPEDYTLRGDGAWACDTGAQATLFSRDVSGHLAAVLEQEADRLAADGAQLALVGTVAWVTDWVLLRKIAAAAAAGVCLVVNKEDWLKPGTYAALPALDHTTLFGSGGMIAPSSSADPAPCAPVWCAGALNTRNYLSFPRMHRKTLILCMRRAPDAYLVPYAVWTGSFNLTQASRDGVEDAMLVHSAPIAAYAYRQFLAVLAHAETLDAIAPDSAPALVAGP